MGNTVYYNEGIVVLNNDGKIPLCGGIPFPKLGDYVPTPFIENQIMVAYIE